MKNSAGRVIHWLRTPKGWAAVALIALLAVAAPVEGPGRIAFQVVAAVVGAAVVDVALGMGRRSAVVIILPDGALITGLIVALVLIAGAPAVVALAAAGLAVASKYFMRTPQFHLFNPAAVGLLVSLVLFPTGQSWWGALADLPPPFIAIVVVAGALVANRVNRLPAVITFLGTSFAAFTVAGLVLGTNEPRVAEVFRVPFINAGIFFACFMLTDPATSPARPGEQIRFAAVAAIASAACFIAVEGLWYLFVGLLAGNAWFAWRRSRVLMNPRRVRDEVA